jgi:RNA polymerase sigma-70 factor (ECF subfamily)
MAEPREPMHADEELLRRCARGDAAAYRELVERMEKPLINFLYRFVQERHAAEDLFQETFVRVVRALAEFRPQASLTTWVFTIARNLALDHLKARRRHREVALDAAASEERGRVIYFKDVLRSGSPEPGGRAEGTEEQRRVVAALARLAPAKREALVLRLYVDLPYGEIARIVRAPVGTVKFRVHEALQDLARDLGAAGASAAQGG